MPVAPTSPSAGEPTEHLRVEGNLQPTCAQAAKRGLLSRQAESDRTRVPRLRPHGPVDQLEDRLVCNQKATGSNPVGSICAAAQTLDLAMPVPRKRNRLLVIVEPESPRRPEDIRGSTLPVRCVWVGEADEGARSQDRGAYAAWIEQRIDSTRKTCKSVWISVGCYNPDGGSLGSGAEEGRAKPRYYSG